MKVSDNFNLREFIPPSVYKKRGDKSIWLLDQRIIGLAQAVRELLDEAVTINGKYKGRTFRNSGYRTPGTSVGAKYSQHRFGRAIDLKFEKTKDYNEIRRIIIANFTELSKYGLTTIEDNTRNWLHLDVRWTLNPNELTIFQP